MISVRLYEVLLKLELSNEDIDETVSKYKKEWTDFKPKKTIYHDKKMDLKRALLSLKFVLDKTGSDMASIQDVANRCVKAYGWSFEYFNELFKELENKGEIYKPRADCVKFTRGFYNG